MIGVLLITHGRYGEDLLASALHVLGKPLERIEHIAVNAQDNPDAVLARARAALPRLDDGSGVLVLTDIFGATPCNVATRLLDAGSVECVSGLSLPMLVRVLTYREAPLAEVLAKALSGGIEGIVDINRDPCYAKR